MPRIAQVIGKADVITRAATLPSPQLLLWNGPVAEVDDPSFATRFR
jgi:hypothetical protein